MKSRTAEKMNLIPFSGIRKVFEKVNELKSQGEDVINLCIGRPDFDTPEHIKIQAKNAMDNGLVHYTSNYGLEELRNVVSEKFKKDNGLNIDGSQVIMTVGANEAVFITMMATLDPDDEVIIPNPTWPHYETCAVMTGAKPVSVPLKEKNGFILDPADLEAAISNKTKLLILNTPGNPTGGVYSESDLEAVAEIAKKHDLLVLSDEIYEHLVYDQARHNSIAKLPGMQDKTIIVNGFSKAYSMTGWRLGYVAAPPDIISAMIRIHQYTVTCATSFVQAGGVSALTSSQECVNEMKSAFDERRKMVVSRLQKIKGINCNNPQGAFYVFPSVKETGLSSEEAAYHFIGHGVAMVPGSAFGEYGEGYLRISYASSYEILEKAMDRIEKAVDLI